MDELLEDLQTEVPSTDGIAADLANAESCETLKDFAVNLREAAAAARDLAKECEALAKKSDAGKY